VLDRGSQGRYAGTGNGIAVGAAMLVGRYESSIDVAIEIKDFPNGSVTQGYRFLD